MTAILRWASLRNGVPLPRRDIPRLELATFQSAITDSVTDGARIAAFFGQSPRNGHGVDLYAILAFREEGILRVAQTHVPGDSFPSLTPDCTQANLFEREIAEQFGLTPETHPWLKPVRFVNSSRPGHDAWGRSGNQPPLVGVTDFYRVEGEEVHEVAVGPVHAGIIEPGHFRFQCHGEIVMHLEIALGYQHRGVESALTGGPTPRTIHYMETLAGDTTVGHTLAYCQALEGLAGSAAPARAQALRAIALELERLANHTGDLGALSGDVGFLPTAAYCGRLRGDFLNMTATLCGNRFSRGLIRPGGVGYDLNATDRASLEQRLDSALTDVENAVNLLWESPSVMARFEGTGALSLETCTALGLVGPAARACGAECDIRQDFPTGIFRFSHIPVSTGQGGDVLERASVRWLEIQRSTAFIREQLQMLPAGPITSQLPGIAPDQLIASLTEGWRGAICHVALTDSHGRFDRYKIVDPSFHNWLGLAIALRNQQISDFPLCNKSFNLSYCGHDL